MRKGEKNPFYGKQHSKAAKQKISKKRKGVYIREKNPNWKGGITSVAELIRKCPKYEVWRQEVFIRDSFACKKCGDTSGGNLVAHHKKGFKELLEEAGRYLPLYDLFTASMLYRPFWDTKNGVTLCEKCHKKKHKKG